VDYDYDALDRLIRVDFSDPSRYVRYWYDGSGLRTKMRNPENEIVSYRYDDAGRLVKVALGETPGGFR
jgi:YD repeat-containing protein